MKRFVTSWPAGAKTFQVYKKVEKSEKKAKDEKANAEENQNVTQDKDSGTETVQVTDEMFVPWSEVVVPLFSTHLGFKVVAYGHNSQRTREKLSFTCREHRTVSIALTAYTADVKKDTDIVWKITPPTKQCVHCK